jgi:signal transduction histidine kinase
LEKRADHLFLSVHDNGKGIRPQNLKQQKSFGLLGMRERTSMLGGEIHIEGRPKAGTTVRVNLPGAFLAVNSKQDI